MCYVLRSRFPLLWLGMLFSGAGVAHFSDLCLPAQDPPVKKTDTTSSRQGSSPEARLCLRSNRQLVAVDGVRVTFDYTVAPGRCPSRHWMATHVHVGSTG